MIKFENVYKSYGLNSVLSDINLNLEKNKIYGLLGRNGVGKTTLLKMLSGMAMPTKGNIYVDDEIVYENENALEKICFISENLFDEFAKSDINYILTIAAILYANWDEEYFQKLVNKFDFDLKIKYKDLNKGRKTLFGLMIGLASQAPITIFDEPTLGLDASVRSKFYQELLLSYEDNPRTFIISTHIIDEAEKIIEDVIILKDEKVLLMESLDNILTKANFLIGEKDEVMKIFPEEKFLYEEIIGSKTKAAMFRNLNAFETQSVELNPNIQVSPMSLQNLFVYLTEKEEKR